MTNVVRGRFRERFCVACRDGKHVQCEDRQSWIFGEDGDDHVPCPCGCWDSAALKTRWAALQDMAARHPEYTATRMWALQRLDNVHVCGKTDISRG